MADGSHGWSPNCADFPVAASSRPMRGKFKFSWFVEKICWSSHVFKLIKNQAMAIINPTSPIRL